MTSKIIVNTIEGDVGVSSVTFNDTIYGNLEGNVEGDITVGTGATISGSTDTIIASTNGSEKVRLTSAGNIGIGTDNPAATLHLLGSGGAATGNEGIRLQTSQATGGNWISFNDTSRKGYFGYKETSDDGIYLVNEENSHIVLGTNGLERLRITSAGEVTMPSQPMMQVWAVTSASKTVSGNSSTTLIPLNAGNTYDPLNDLDSSTGVYTIPVTGRYLTFYGTEGKTADNISTGSIYYNINNAGIAGQCLYYGDRYSGNSKQVILSLAAGDTIKWQIYGNNNIGYTINAAVYGIHFLG